MNSRASLVTISTIFLSLGTIKAAWQFKGCDDINGKDHFKMVPLVNLTINDKSVREPTEMDFDMDAAGNVDVYFIQRHGDIKKYDAKLKNTVVIGQIKPQTGNEDGLTGLKLDPKFKENGWIYLFYSASDGFRVSRFTTIGGKMDNASEKVLLKIPSGRSRWHTGGALEFDRYGNLIISVGDNEACEKGPANTNDLRGKILKITPKADGTYDIPKGNLWEFAAAKFEKDGKPDIAKQYRDPTLVRREIYAMGMRNAYSIGTDPKSDWIAYGDCGPDYRGGNSEEHSVVTGPGFYGWPYFTGYDYVQPKYPGGYDEKGESFWGKGTIKRDNPINNGAGNTGVKQLLPETPALHAFEKACAMSGGWYRYDSTLKSKIKLPPHLDGVWFFADFNSKRIWAAKLDPAGKSIVKQELMWDANSFGDYGKMLDLQVGPDGAFYILGYTCGPWRTLTRCNGIYRIEYTGDCLPYKESTAVETQRVPPSRISIQGKKIHIECESKHRLFITDTKGRIFFESAGEKAMSYDMPSLSKSGLYFVRIQSRNGVTTKAFTIF